MLTKADITDHTQLRELLKPLRAEAKPLWGKMSAQQMIEHLIEQLRYTNGVLEPILDVAPDVALRRKLITKQRDADIPKNVYLGELPDTLEYPDLETAIDQLILELKRFDRHFETPGREAIHGGFGPMNHEEWIWWHNKHFTHHFKQFGLMPE